VVRPWRCCPENAPWTPHAPVDAPSLEVFKASLDGALDNHGMELKLDGL